MQSQLPSLSLLVLPLPINGVWLWLQLIMSGSRSHYWLHCAAKSTRYHTRTAHHPPGSRHISSPASVSLRIGRARAVLMTIMPGCTTAHRVRIASRRKVGRYNSVIEGWRLRWFEGGLVSCWTTEVASRGQKRIRRRVHGRISETCRHRNWWRSFSPVDGVGQSRSFAELLVIVLRRARTVMGALKDSTLVTELCVERIRLRTERWARLCSRFCLGGEQIFASSEDYDSCSWNTVSSSGRISSAYDFINPPGTHFTYLWRLFNFRVGRISYFLWVLFIHTCTPLCQWRRSPSVIRRGSVPSFSRSCTATPRAFPFTRCTKIWARSIWLSTILPLPRREKRRLDGTLSWVAKSIAINVRRYRGKDFWRAIWRRARMGRHVTVVCRWSQWVRHRVCVVELRLHLIRTVIMWWWS